MDSAKTFSWEQRAHIEMSKSYFCWLTYIEEKYFRSVVFRYMKFVLEL